jgi:hypothetical protein
VNEFTVRNGPVLSSKYYPVMTLRDEFAARALQSIVADLDFTFPSDASWEDGVTEMAWRLADLMIQKRNPK